LPDLYYQLNYFYIREADCSNKGKFIYSGIFFDNICNARQEIAEAFAKQFIQKKIDAEAARQQQEATRQAEIAKQQQLIEEANRQAEIARQQQDAHRQAEEARQQQLKQQQLIDKAKFTAKQKIMQEQIQAAKEVYRSAQDYYDHTHEVTLGGQHHWGEL
jgi:hypothetical protein